jgi:hypothetical protein
MIEDLLRGASQVKMPLASRASLCRSYAVDASDGAAATSRL